MISTDEVMLKLHAAKSRAVFLSDFLGDPISLPLQVQINTPLNLKHKRHPHRIQESQDLTAVTEAISDD
jgi:hypothetical protein